jgi:predicted amidophosphoribosyltransferase
MRERHENVTGAFTANKSLAGLRIVLIDDVLTTGATLSACAQAAYDAGASFVFGLTVCHARDLASL